MVLQQTSTDAARASQVEQQDVAQARLVGYPISAANPILLQALTAHLHGGLTR